MPLFDDSDWTGKSQINNEHFASIFPGGRKTVDGVPERWYKFDEKFHPTLLLVEDAVRVLLAHIGVDISDEGVKDTPSRVVSALLEMTKGYQRDPKEILSKTFDEPFDELIIAAGVPFTSLCEHHLLPFSGTVDVGYIPSDKGLIVGLSKLARLVDCFSQRLQIQERLTRQIAESIETHLKPLGVAVVVRAEHSCMACRGVKKSGVTMITSSMLGVMLANPSARAEFLELCRG